MTITIAGLGLMGGSLAMALRGFEGAVLWGVDTEPDAREAVIQSGAVDAVFEEPQTGSDVVIACMPPADTVGFAGRYVSRLKPGSIFCEFCGIKAMLVPKIASLLPSGVDYIPLHPMAGKETSGFAAADPRLFSGAGLIVTPPDGLRPRRASLIERTARYVGFSEIVYTTPEHHDAMIAYTSHLTHISASALCLSMPEGLTKVYTGGAFRDGTSVAAVDAGYWAALMLSNRDHVLAEIKRLQSSLDMFRGAVEADDAAVLSELLDKAKRNKQDL